MLKNKRGLSAIVMTIIMIGLVLVAVGIVWVVVLGILEGQSESLDYNQNCLGLSFKIKNLDCTGGNCNFVIERSIGSTGSPIDGIAVTFSNASASGEEEPLAGNVAATLTKSGVSAGVTGVTRADARIYFDKEDDTKHYCSQIISSE